ncbi:MAG: SPOR domain-containing protein [Betaproteobacteria bacterium]|nr:SPOR domain-containing protein [Betaproteobacteria bacterium]
MWPRCVPRARRSRSWASKTYTQVIEADAGKRTRVRLGPYATRDEADAAAAKLKGAGLPANVLAL